MLKLMVLCAVVAVAKAETLHTEVLSSTYLGSSFDQDEVMGVRILKDGTLVVAANVGDQVFEGAKVVDLPGFLPPTEAKPDPVAFENREAYVEAAIGWIGRNIPGAPPVPKMEDEWIQREIEQRRSKLKKKNRIEKVPDQVLSGARSSYAEKWAEGWAGGCLLRISADSSKVISQLRIGPQIQDLHLDANDNIYLAAGPNGVMSLKPDALTLRKGWPQQEGQFVRRVHASPDGYVITLVGTLPGTLTTYDSKGKQLAQRKGSRRTEDVAISPENGLAYFTGYKVTRAPSQEGGEWRTYPVHIPYLKTFDYKSGQDRWTNYDWRGRIKLSGKLGSEGELPDDFLNKSANNMADSRGCRVTLGDDGKLYLAMEAAGGNHPMRWEPKDIMTRVGEKMAGGDSWHRFSNTRASHKTVIGRYDPKSGDLERIQEFNTLVLEKGKFPSANALRLEHGDIHADADGRLYITGQGATGLPIRHAPRFGAKDDPPNFNPFDRTVLTKGSFLMVMSPDFSKREFTTRLSPNGYGHSVDTRVVNGKLEVVWGGKAGLRQPTYTRRALQPTPGWGRNDGFLAKLGDASDLEGAGKRFKLEILGEGLVMKEHQGSLSKSDLNGDGQQDVSISLGLQTQSPIAMANGQPIFGGFKAQAMQTGTREVKGPTSFHRGKGGLGLLDIGRGSNLGNEKQAKVRAWAVLMHPIAGPGERLGFGRGDRFQVSLSNHFGLGQARAMLFDGTSWFVSEKNLKEDPVLTFQMDSSDGRWAALDPVALLNANEPPALLKSEEGEVDPRYQEMNFENIQAVGLLLGGDWRGARRSGGMVQSWSLQMAVDPKDDPAPVAVPTITPRIVERFALVSLDASKSHDHGAPLGFIQWNLGRDGSTSGVQLEHRFENAGLIPVELTVWDAEGATSKTPAPVSVYLEGMELGNGLVPIVSHVGAGGVKHFSLGGLKEQGEWLYRAPSFESPVMKGPGGPVYGALVAQKDKRPFRDYGSRSMGSSTRPMGFVKSKTPGKAGLLFMQRQDQFLSGAAASGADLRKGSLHARGIKGGQVYWVLHGPAGWFISQDPAPVLSSDRMRVLQQEVADVTWLSWNPESAAGMLNLSQGQSAPQAAAVVDAMGVLILMQGGEWSFAAIGATGSPVR